MRTNRQTRRSQPIKLTNKKAFTLVELLVVIAVIGILFIALVIRMSFATDKAKVSGIETDFRSYQMAFKAVATENAGFSDLVDTSATNPYTELERQINKNLDPDMKISIGKDGSIKSNAVDKWGNLYQGRYLPPDEDGIVEDKGAIIMLSPGSDASLGISATIENGIVVFGYLSGQSYEAADDYATSVIYTFANGFGETKTDSFGFDDKDTIASIGGSGGSGGSGGTSHTHTPGPEATCSTAQTCTTCGAELVGAKGHTEVTDLAVDATCTESGLTEGKHCSVCNEVIIAQESISALGHASGAEATCTTAQTCTRCGVELVAMKGHTEVTIPATAPTCISSGLTEGKACSSCGQTLQSQTIVGALGHTSGADATCTDPQSCTVCGDIIQSANGHAPGAEATCTTNQTCTVCSVELVAAKGHTEVTDAAVVATCTETGLTEGKHCSVCNEVLVAQTTIAAKGHTEVTDVAVAATCTETGLTEGKHCSVCNAVLTAQETVDALGHNYTSTVTAPTATADGYATYTCDGCGDSYNETITPTAFTVTSGNRSQIGYTGATGENLVIPAVFESDGTWYRVTTISSSAFSGCSSLTSIEIPASVSTIGSNAFDNCKNLKTVYYDGTVEQWCNITLTNYASSPCFNGAALHIGGELADDLDIPNTVTTIGGWAFRGCTSLTNITIPDSVTSIGTQAFYQCKNLSTVTFGKNSQLKSIGSSAFDSCTNLTSIEIPASVTTIGDYAFDGCTSLTTVTFAEGSQLTTIGEATFRDCTNLTIVTPPDSVTTIGQWAFENCTRLASVPFGENSQLTTIGNMAFSDCTNLTSIGPVGSGASLEIPYSVTSIGNQAFGGCTKLGTVNFGENIQLTTIGAYAFQYCTSLTSIEIPDSVITIGTRAFYQCKNLSMVNFGENSQLTTIGDSAFNGCQNLTSVDIPDGVMSIGSSAFQNVGAIETVNSVKYVDDWVVDCDYSATSVVLREGTRGIVYRAFYNRTSLTSIEIPASVIAIGQQAFENCSGLESVTIPNGVTTIGDYAFYGCTSLESSTIPASVTTIGYQAFYGCSGLTSIAVDANNQNYCSVNGVLFNKNMAELICYPAGKSGTSYTTPDCVTTVGDYAFCDCTNLETITFGVDSQLTTIGYRAFYNCTSLTSIEISNSVTTISERAFQSCTNLTSVDIPASVTTIDTYVFCNCTGLTTINFEGTVTQWNAITKGGSWNYNVPATTVVCSDGTVALS